MRTLRAAAIILAFLVTATWAPPAWSWGDLGHQVVCEIAFQELNTKARREVRRLMAKDEDADPPRLFSVGCTWPDHPRKRANDHFINAPRDFTTFTAQECPMAETCLFKAIRADFQGATIDSAYLEVHGAIVADRLKRAGVRLGQMLNQALGQ